MHIFRSKLGRSCRCKFLQGHGYESVTESLLIYEGFLKYILTDSHEWCIQYSIISSFLLVSIHKNLLGGLPTQSHGAEADCMALMRITNAIGIDLKAKKN